jgi:hypothetical protein
MVLVCPKCGNQVPPPKNPNNTFTYCPRCAENGISTRVYTGSGGVEQKVEFPFIPKQPDKNPGKNDNEKNIVVNSNPAKPLGPKELRIIKSLVVTAIVGICLYVLLLTGTSSEGLLRFFQAITGDQGTLAQFWPNITMIAFIIILAIVFYVNYKVPYDSLGTALVCTLPLILLTTFYPVLSYQLSLAGWDMYIESIRCTMLTLTDPMAGVNCGVSKPKDNLIKEQIYNVLDISIDGTTGNSIYKNKTGFYNLDTFSMTLVVKNPSDTTAVTGFKLVSTSPKLIGDKTNAIIRGGTSRPADQIKIADLVPYGVDCANDTIDAKGCTIEPGQTLRVPLLATPVFCTQIIDQYECEARDTCRWNVTNIYAPVTSSSGICYDIGDKTSTEAKASVAYSYDYRAEGKNDYIVAESDEIAAPRIKALSGPRTYAGQVDVKVTFAPDVYVFRGAGQSNIPQMIMNVELSRQQGTAILKSPVTIIRLADGGVSDPLLQPIGTCTDPYGKQLTLTSISRYNDNIELSGTNKLTDKLTYTCRYTVNYNGVNSDSSVDEVSVVPFLVGVDYTFQNSVQKPYIKVVTVG